MNCTVVVNVLPVEVFVTGMKKMDQLTFLRAAQGIKTNCERQIPLGTKEVRLILIFEPNNQELQKRMK